MCKFKKNLARNRQSVGDNFERPIMLKPARFGGSVATIFPELAQVKLFAGYWLQYHIYYHNYNYYYYYYHQKIIITIIIIIIFFQNINKSVIISMGLHYSVHQSLFFGLFSFLLKRFRPSSNVEPTCAEPNSWPREIASLWLKIGK